MPIIRKEPEHAPNDKIDDERLRERQDASYWTRRP